MSQSEFKVPLRQNEFEALVVIMRIIYPTRYEILVSVYNIVECTDKVTWSNLSSGTWNLGVIFYIKKMNPPVGREIRYSGFRSMGCEFEFSLRHFHLHFVGRVLLGPVQPTTLEQEGGTFRFAIIDSTV